MREPGTFDAVIVGSGFAGSWAAKELTEAGFRTLLLEAGPLLTPGDIPVRNHRRDGISSGPGDWQSQRIQHEHPAFLERGPHLFVDDGEHPYETPAGLPFYWIRGMQVGGRSLTWGGTALRLSPHELDAADLDGCELRWPLRYRDLTGAYRAVEEMMGLCGTAEGMARLPDSSFRTRGGPLTPAEQDFQLGYRATGTRPVPVRYIPDMPRQGEWPGHTMQATALAAAIRTGLLRVRTDSVATQVTTDAQTGLATGIRYVDTRTRTVRHARGRVVFLCCGTIETARLMLNSRGDRHPDGLGNSSGWLGRGLMDHPVLYADGILDSYPPVSGYDPSFRQSGLLVPPPTREQDNVRPFGIWANLQRRTEAGSGAPLGFFSAQGEVLPYWGNRVTLSERRDKWGVPVPVIECRYGSHEKRQYEAMRAAVEHAATVVGLRITAIAASLTAPGLNVHELGTARMGSSPGTSVLSSENRCWDCLNVFVTDGACFPSAGWQNPTLTIMALSARAGRIAATLLRESTY
ncbi:GMC family oxidoreductase [Nonomuraea monospora]|uniref:GMC family oxidoreductase n=1 Tax=Nonomuraea monospora TaxID=568818 RepID=A0ABN3C6Q4_9ACTN